MKECEWANVYDKVYELEMWKRNVLLIRNVIKIYNLGMWIKNMY